MKPLHYTTHTPIQSKGGVQAIDSRERQADRLPPSEGQTSEASVLDTRILKQIMHTRKDLMTILGLTYIQVRERLDTLDTAGGLLEGQVKKGPKGRLEYTSEALRMLQELEELAINHGLSLAQAAEELSGKIRPEEEIQLEDVDIKGINLETAILRERAEALARENNLLRAQLAKAWELVDSLKALPAPKRRRRWFSWRKSPETQTAST